MASYIYLIFTNAKPGREQEFNDWYTDEHLQDVLRIPGMKAAQRFRLSSMQRTAPPHPWTYAAIYDIETDDLPALMEELRTRAGTNALPLSDAMSPERLAYYFEPMTGRVIAEGPPASAA